MVLIFLPIFCLKITSYTYYYLFKLLDIGLIKASSSLLEKEDDDDDQTSDFPAVPAASTQQPFYDGPVPTPRQKPFQSGSTPAHLMHRFMVNHSGWLWRVSRFVNIEYCPILAVS